MVLPGMGVEVDELCLLATFALVIGGLVGAALATAFVEVAVRATNEHPNLRKSDVFHLLSVQYVAIQMRCFLSTRKAKGSRKEESRKEKANHPTMPLDAMLP